MPIQQLVCTGNAYEIGLQHGTAAADKVRGSIAFYKRMFSQYTGKSWDEITDLALEFGQNIELRWPEYLEEMKGIADGAQCKVSDIVALNTRTEIAFGLMKPERLMSDGCTSLAWPEYGLMSQNWDWMEEQSPNVLFITIQRKGKPAIKMMTEAGIIGKIGANSVGVGVLLNAIRCIGNDASRIPIHLALRIALDSETLEQAVETLMETGTGGSGFLLIGQDERAVGLEFTSESVRMLSQDHLGCITHSNHLVMQHDDANEWPEDDSIARLARMRQLTEEVALKGGPKSEFDMVTLFDDHDGLPVSICRAQEGISKDGTLFNIFMDLKKRRGRVRIGRICKLSETIEFSFARA